jgi:two-component system sensor histidine kinase TctE
MKRLTPSIRTQLLFWLLVPILVLLSVGVALSYGLAIGLATDAYDKALLDSVHSIVRCIQRKDKNIIVDVPPAALAILRDDTSDKVYYQVLDKDSHLIAGDRDMPPVSPGPDLVENASDCRDGSIDGEQVRIAVVSVAVPGSPKQFVYVQVGETMHQRERIADQILMGIILPQFGILGLSALLVWFGVRRGLLPLSNVRDAVARRSPIDLSPLDLENVPAEVRPLVTAINELLDRLQQDIQAQRRFVANAAHQLRTPIAGLKTQTEVALRQTDPEDLKHALSLIHMGADRAARLANQLLALARAEPGAIDSKLWRRFDLNSLAKSACREFVPQALCKNVDLGLEGDSGPQFIRGDESSLHELACNLIHNAVQYTPSGGHVTVQVSPVYDETGAWVDLIVEDDGPGIPEEERERVFERFYRLIDRRVGGSGLGLAIVREIALLHRAEIALEDGPGGVGARVRVRFAAAAATTAVTATPSLSAAVATSAVAVNSTGSAIGAVPATTARAATSPSVVSSSPIAVSPAPRPAAPSPAVRASSSTSVSPSPKAASPSPTSPSANSTAETPG